MEDSGAAARECEWMACALGEARRAAEEGDVPVGAVVVVRGEIIARAHNRREADRDPTAQRPLGVRVLFLWETFVRGSWGRC